MLYSAAIMTLGIGTAVKPRRVQDNVNCFALHYLVPLFWLYDMCEINIKHFHNAGPQPLRSRVAGITILIPYIYIVHRTQAWILSIV